MSKGLTPYFYASNSDILAGARELLQGTTRYTKAGNIFAKDVGDLAMMVLNTIPEASKLAGGHLENRGIRRPIVNFINDMRQLGSPDRLLLRYATSWASAIIWEAHNVALLLWDRMTGNPRTVYSLMNFAKSMNVFKNPAPAVDLLVGTYNLVVMHSPWANGVRVVWDYFDAVIYGLGFSLREWLHQITIYSVNAVRVLIGLPAVEPTMPASNGHSFIPGVWKSLRMPVRGHNVINRM